MPPQKAQSRISPGLWLWNMRRMESIVMRFVLAVSGPSPNLERHTNTELQTPKQLSSQTPSKCTAKKISAQNIPFTEQVNHKTSSAQLFSWQVQKQDGSQASICLLTEDIQRSEKSEFYLNDHELQYHTHHGQRVTSKGSYSV